MSKDTGGPAFPAEGGCDSGLHAAPVMTLRDYFAGQALLIFHAPNARYGEPGLRGVAAQSYAMADAMLAERAKGGES